MRTRLSGSKRIQLSVLSVLLAITFARLHAPFPVFAQVDPLATWNEGAAKTAILTFVQTTTDPTSRNFVPPSERIVTFDQDGTLWVEHPMYTQVVYCLDRVPALVKAKPALANVEPFKTVLTGNLEAIAKLPMPIWRKSSPPR